MIAPAAPVPLVSLVVALVRRGWFRWAAEVTDPASAVAGLSIEAPTRQAAGRRIAIAAAHELGRCTDLPIRVEVIAWQTGTYSLRRR